MDTAQGLGTSQENESELAIPPKDLRKENRNGAQCASLENTHITPVKNEINVQIQELGEGQKNGGST
jgi:hypothetical protein